MTGDSTPGPATLRQATLRIDLAAARANWRHFAGLAAEAGAQAGATIKANAYGLGADRLGPAFEAEGCHTFFVAQAAEGAALRQALKDPACAIYVYSGPLPGEENTYLDNSLRPVLNSPEQLELWRSEGAGCPCALHVDTGMSRLGLEPDQARDLAAAGTGDLNLNLLMSHLACADEPDHPLTARQHAKFLELSALFPSVPRSLSNSGGALCGPDYQFDLTRPGIGLYGGQPRTVPDPALSPIATIEAPILQIRTVRAGETVGYGASFAAKRDMRVATVSLGYADGFIRAASPGAYALFGQTRAPLVGRISMDLTAVDVTDIPDAAPGDCATFLGPALEDTARAAGTISYELLTRLGPRFRRVYAG